MESQNKKIKQFGGISVAARLKKISDNLLNDTAKTYREFNIELEPRWFPLTAYLYENGESSILDIASSLGYTHPAVIQFTNQMIEKKLVISKQDEKDKRKRMVNLSAKGKNLFESVKPVLPDIENAFEELSKETNLELIYTIQKLEKALKTKSLFARIREKTKQRMMDELEIVTYHEKYNDDFKKLNYEWLEEYFYIEPEDKKILSNPEEIVEQGGEIFFAKLENKVVGTCSAIKADDESYELAKMAVTPEAQGRQIGKKLALAVIGFAYSKGAKSVVLSTSHKLPVAINLYEKLGFQYIPGADETNYERTTIKMKLDLYEKE